MASAPRALLFGTAGVPFSAEDPSTLAGIERVKALGLDGQEIEFVQGVAMGLDTARKVRERAEALGVRLSVHAPYHINLNSEDPGKRLASQERLLKTARIGEACGATSAVFHAAFYGQDPPEKAYEAVRSGLRTVLSILRRERLGITLRVETMGKRAQFGSLDEVLSLCRDLEGLQPCLDFSHLHAREGKINSYSEFEQVLRKVARKLGPRALRNAHIHIAGIHYGDRGEIKHLNLGETDFRYDEWLQALRDLGVEGMVVCESPNLEADAVMLKRLYRAQGARSV
ncbi:MAG TPA: TIM barrel protein [Candidatus Aminicenantes bacterium]|mgnify:CR=1 FL=1|nr:TIM barrel protein [Candidatus Aminicenantes bacterium]